MSDTNAFINAYIDNSIGMIHENIASILQLKAQLKVANDSLAQKDAVISNLSNEIEQLKNTTEEMSQLRLELQQSIDANHGLVNKVSHMDALLNQMNQMKAMVLERDSKIEQLTKEIERMKNPESALNSKSKKTTKGSQESLSSSKVETDDF